MLTSHEIAKNFLFNLLFILSRIFFFLQLKKLKAKFAAQAVLYNVEEQTSC